MNRNNTDYYGEPEVFWCSYCGKNIWVVVRPNTQPEALICDECKSIYKNKDSHY